jgi:hypothetical protein
MLNAVHIFSTLALSQLLDTVNPKRVTFTHQPSTIDIATHPSCITFLKCAVNYMYRELKGRVLRSLPPHINPPPRYLNKSHVFQPNRSFRFIYKIVNVSLHNLPRHNSISLINQPPLSPSPLSTYTLTLNLQHNALPRNLLLRPALGPHRRLS